MSQFLLDPVTNDLVRVGGSFVRVSGREEIRQNIKFRLLLFRGEAPLNTDIGVPYFEEVLIKGIDVASLQNVFRDAILGAKGVTSIELLDIEYQEDSRNLTVTFEATGTLDELAEDLKIEDTVEVPL